MFSTMRREINLESSDEFKYHIVETFKLRNCLFDFSYNANNLQSYINFFLLKKRELKLEKKESFYTQYKFSNCLKFENIQVLKEIKDTTDNDINAFLLGCYYGHSEKVEPLILNDYQEIYYENEFGCNGLHLACENGNYDIVKCILDNKLTSLMFSKNHYNKTPFHYAVASGNIEIINEFLKSFKSLEFTQYTIQNDLIEEYKRGLKSQHSFSSKVKRIFK